MDASSEIRQFLWQRQTRRAFLGRTSQGVGALALASLIRPALWNALAESPAPAQDKWTGVVHPPHYPPKAKRVIWLTMAGGPSHLETFDPTMLTCVSLVVRRRRRTLSIHPAQWSQRRRDHASADTPAARINALAGSGTGEIHIRASAPEDLAPQPTT